MGRRWLMESDARGIHGQLRSLDAFPRSTRIQLLNASQHNPGKEKSVSANMKSGLSPEFAGVLRETLLYWASRELETTKKVLSAIPETKTGYRPDPHARTAWELAWHLASMDIHF